MKLFRSARLASLCAVLGACAAKPHVPARKEVSKAALAPGRSQELDKVLEGARVAVRLAWRGRSRPSGSQTQWSYRLKYEVGGQPHELVVGSASATKPAIHVATRTHLADDTDFVIKVLAVEVSGTAAADVHLELDESSSEMQAAEAASITAPANVTTEPGGKISWTAVTNATGYELQWVFVDSNDQTPTDPFFGRPTGTIEVQKAEAQLELGYPSGKVYVRVRALGSFPHSDTIRRGLWAGASPIDLAAGPLEDSSWFRTTRFDSEGTNRTTIKHYDSLLRERQQIEASQPSSLARVTETILDDEGRPALTTLPVPLVVAPGANRLAFVKDFTVPFGTSTELSSAGLRTGKPPELAESGAGGFFKKRILAGLADTAEERWLPQEPRPYTSTVFARDSRARPVRLNGVGTPLHDHPSTFISGSAGVEFRQLLGASAGLLANYTRDVSIDPNEQGHVRYTDPAGRLVATGLVGKAPIVVTDATTTPARREPVLSRLDDNPLPGGPTIETPIEIPATTLAPNQKSNEFVHTLVNSAPTDYAFSYTLDPSTTAVSLATSPPSSVCPYCKYTADIVVQDPFGARLPCVQAADLTNGSCSNGTYSITVGEEASCNPPARQISFKITLTSVGEYRVVRRVTLDDSAVLDFVSNHSNSVPGAPAKGDVKEHVEGTSKNPCALSECKSDACTERLIREMARRECEGLEATARLERQQRIAAQCDLQQQTDPSVACDSNVAEAASFTCPPNLCPIEGAPKACCHARWCRTLMDESIRSKLYEVRLARATNWQQADSQRLLDPAAMSPPSVRPCNVANSGSVGSNCLDPIFVTPTSLPFAAVLQSQIRQRLREYKPDFCDSSRKLSLWEYVNLPLFGFNDETKWAVFRGAYLAIRTESLTAVTNQRPAGCSDTPSCCGGGRWCPYNDIVKAPDLTFLNGSAEEIEQAALVARAEHCNLQCEANVCNWRWQLADGLCPAYSPFPSGSATYVCDASTPSDAVRDHLVAYCLRRCNYELDPSGAFSAADLASDPDLVAAAAAARGSGSGPCGFGTLASSLIDPDIVCAQQCKTTLRPTACGAMLAWFIENRKRLKEDELRRQIKQLGIKCPELAEIIEANGRVVVGDCEIWLVDENGRAVPLEDLIGNLQVVAGWLPAALSAEHSSTFTGLVVRTGTSRVAYVLSDCPFGLMSSSGQCCPGRNPNSTSVILPEAAKPTAEQVCAAPGEYSPPSATIVEAAVSRSDDLFACVAETAATTAPTPGDVCTQEYTDRLSAVLKGADVDSTGRCSIGTTVHDKLVHIESAQTKGCWFELLTGKSPQPWLQQGAWSIVGIESAPLPAGYPDSRQHTAANSQFTIRYTGVRFVLVGPAGAKVSVYVYSNCPMSVAPACDPVGGNFKLTISPYKFDGWKKACESDAEDFQDKQTDRIYEDGKADATDNWTSMLIAHCMGGNLGEKFKVAYQAAEYAHTLFFYDQVGNLSAIVPPRGVKKLEPNSVGEISATAVPVHEMLTRVRYDARNSIVSRLSPDAGSAIFVYDRRGRRRFAQTSEQVSRQEWSYAEYDGLDRVVETGLTGPYSASQARALADGSLPADARRDERVESSYGPVEETPAGTHTRGRVRRIYANLSAAAVSYEYSASGQIKTFRTQHAALGTKTARYRHDLADDALLSFDYQADSEGEKPDEFHQRYTYDSERRLVRAESSTDGITWERDAAYTYYTHGPLRRGVLGDERIQGVDHTYTIQGWPKAVNAGDASPDRDPGRDGKAGAEGAALPPRDLIGLVYSYFEGDFVSAETAFMTGDTSSRQVFARDGPDLFTGIIRNRVLTHRALDEAAQPERTRYNYDQLPRLTDSILTTTAGSSSVVAAGCFELDGSGLVRKASGTPVEAALPAGSTCYRYDANGNLTLVKRWGRSICAGNFDRLEYRYDPTNNRLLHVDDDQIANEACASDIDDQGTFVAANPTVANYGYDAVGRLTRDGAEGISGIGAAPGITWSRADKVLSVQKPGGTSLTFAYDGLERRFSKTAGTTATFYVWHPDGRMLATYKAEGSDTASGAPTVSGHVLYAGTKRIGVRLPLVSRDPVADEVARSNLHYELVDHLGSVLAIVNGEGDVVSAADYYPFGMLQPGRESAIGGVRFGFGGYEKDDELKQPAASYVTNARFYDPRLGRWLSPDPAGPVDAPNLYTYALNNPILLVDGSGTAVAIPYSQRSSGPNDVQSKGGAYTVYEFRVYGFESYEAYTSAVAGGKVPEHTASFELTFDTRQFADGRRSILEGGEQLKSLVFLSEQAGRERQAKYALQLTDQDSGRFTGGGARNNPRIKVHGGGPDWSAQCATSPDPTYRPAGGNTQAAKGGGRLASDALLKFERTMRDALGLSADSPRAEIVLPGADVLYFEGFSISFDFSNATSTNATSINGGFDFGGTEDGSRTE